MKLSSTAIKVNVTADAAIDLVYNQTNLAANTIAKAPATKETRSVKSVRSAQSLGLAATPNRRTPALDYLGPIELAFARTSHQPPSQCVARPAKAVLRLQSENESSNRLQTSPPSRPSRQRSICSARPLASQRYRLFQVWTVELSKCFQFHANDTHRLSRCRRTSGSPKSLEVWPLRLPVKTRFDPRLKSLQHSVLFFIGFDFIHMLHRQSDVV